MKRKDEESNFVVNFCRFSVSKSFMHRHFFVELLQECLVQ